MAECYQIVGIAGTHGKLVESYGHVAQLRLRTVEACANHPASCAALLYIALTEGGREGEPTIVEGIVEVDECFIKESFKGNHSKSTTFVMPRNPRKRGKGKNDKKKRGISKEQICIETAIDRKGNILMSAVCNGRITTNQIINFFDNKICEDATFCVDSHKSYMAIKDKLNIELKQVPRGKSMIDSVYHLQHINALHSSFKRWLMTFNGVSTKYINNYLAWFKFLQLSKKNKKNDRIKDMLVNVATKDTYVTRATIRNRFIELI